MKSKKIARVVYVVGFVITVLLLIGTGCIFSGEVKDSRGKVAAEYKYEVRYVESSGGLFGSSTILYYTDEEPTIDGEDRVIRNYRCQSGGEAIGAVTIGLEARVPAKYSSVTQRY